MLFVLQKYSYVYLYRLYISFFIFFLHFIDEMIIQKKLIDRFIDNKTNG